jgi:glycosyltransferase involved in cell wall biosynthesis
MLGWEYPPHISGGLGTACEGLTKALAGEAVDVTFVVPRAFGDEDDGHMQLVSPQNVRQVAKGATRTRTSKRDVESTELVDLIEINSVLRPYQTPESYRTHRTEARVEKGTIEAAETEALSDVLVDEPAAGAHYGTDLFAEVTRYAKLVGQLAERVEFDVIHAHDWMTYPAALEARHRSGKPLVVHTHSLEFDRSGGHVNEGIHKIERAGVRGADHIISVSHYTKGVVVKQHGVDPGRISVVHNGVTRAEGVKQYHLEEEEARSKPTVLFLGRVTYQKGPEFFVQAAKKVLSKTKNVRFVMAGSGDMLEDMKGMARELGIYEHFDFPGFVRGAELEKIFTLASVYVMPSRSEPFGITPLEAMAYDTPVIVSRQSGVSEVLQHALKVDYWDVDRTAQLILAILNHRVLSDEMLEMGSKEVLQLHWQAAARKVKQVYAETVGAGGLEPNCYPF